MQINPTHDEHLSTLEKEIKPADVLTVTEKHDGAFSKAGSNECLVAFSVSGTAHYQGNDRKMLTLYDKKSMKIIAQHAVIGDGVFIHIMPTAEGKKLVFAEMHSMFQGFPFYTCSLLEIINNTFVESEAIKQVNNEAFNNEKHNGSYTNNILYMSITKYGKTESGFSYFEDFELVETFVWNPQKKIFESNE